MTVSVFPEPPSIASGRWRDRSRSSEPLAPKPRPTPARALALDEREQVLSVLYSEQFQDCALAATHAQSGSRAWAEATFAAAAR